MYEVLWVRQFTHLLGASTYAITVVLTTFMCGLGSGAWIIGKMADGIEEKKLIRAYVLIEIGIGTYALLFPHLLEWTEGVYVKFYHVYLPNPILLNGFKLVLASILLTVPTLLIGATLPVLSRYIIRDRRGISLTISHLYAYNTIGAIIGTIATGYFLLPALGIRSTNLVAVGISFLVAAGFYLLDTVSGLIAMKQSGHKKAAVQRSAQKSTSLQKSIVLGFAVSGTAAMFYEVAWTRTLSMILGTTTYAFTTMLAAFLLGIGLGSILYRWIPESIPRIRLFSILQAIIGLSVLMTIPAFEKLPFLFITFHMRWADSWINLQIIRFAMALLVMIVPCLAMGILFPVVSSLFIERAAHVGARLGKVYAWNTYGASIGAALAGLALVPGIGMQKTIVIGGAMNLMAGMGIYLLRTEISWRRRLVISSVTGIAALLIILNIAPWAPRIMSSGAYVYASRYEAALDRYRAAARLSESIPDASEWMLWEMAMKQFRLLYYNPGITATVAVMERDDGVRFLTIDGKTDASTGKKSDLRTQVMIGQLPLLFHESPDEVLVVGLGSGITVGSVLTHDVRVVDCAEISPGVIEAAKFFSNANHRALEDKRLKIIPQDARHMLLTSKKNYDVIISQPSNPWISGESSLFSQEWYHLVHDHLNKEGLFLQWVPSYLMDERDLKVIIHTMRSVFPNLSLWSSGAAGDLILLAGKGAALRIDYDRFSKRISREQVHRDIARIGLDPMLLPFRLFVMNPAKLSSYLYSNLQRPLGKNTDDHLITEFSTPKRMIRNQKVTRFLDPVRSHGNVKDVMAMIDHLRNDEILRILNEKIAKRGGRI